MSDRIRNRWILHAMAFGIVSAAGALPARATVLTSETFVLPSAPGNPASAPYVDMVVDTSPITAWGEKGAVGLQGSQAIFPSGASYVNTPASTVAFKFNIGAAVDSLNATYGAGNPATIRITQAGRQRSRGPIRGCSPPISLLIRCSSTT